MQTAKYATESLAMLAGSLRRSAERGRVEAYFRRVDEHIAGVDKAAALGFLNAELAKWFERYKQFQRTLFKDCEILGNASAWQYAETIAVLSTKIGRLQRQQDGA